MASSSSRTRWFSRCSIRSEGPLRRCLRDSQHSVEGLRRAKGQQAKASMLVDNVETLVTASTFCTQFAVLSVAFDVAIDSAVSSSARKAVGLSLEDSTRDVDIIRRTSLFTCLSLSNFIVSSSCIFIFQKHCFLQNLEKDSLFQI
jgi:hypothetical protein